VPKVVNAIEEHYPGIYQNHFAELGKVQKHWQSWQLGVEYLCVVCCFIMW
jgi:hypothetical protein